MTEKEIIQEVERYIKGELTGAEIDALWMEFLKNPEYYHLFETDLHLRHLAAEAKKSGHNSLRALKESDSISAAESSGKPQKRSFAQWIGAMAAVVIFGLFIHFAILDKDDAFSSLALSGIGVENLSGTDIFRSEEESAGALDIAINQGVAYALSGSEQRAKTMFERVLERDPNNEQQARAQKNLGILLYNSGEFEMATDYLLRAAESTAISLYFQERACWYLGNSYLRLDQTEESKEALTKAIDLDGQFKEDAETLLRRIDEKLTGNG